LSNPKDESAVLYVRPLRHGIRHFSSFSHMADTRYVVTRPEYLRCAGSKVWWMVCLEEVCGLHLTWCLSDLPSSNSTFAADSYGFGLVIHFAFNPSQPAPPTSHPPHPPPQPSSRGAIPGAIFPLFKKLLVPDPRSRMAIKTFLDIGMSEASGEGSGFFSHNRLVNICQDLDNFALSSDSEKSNMIRFVVGLVPRQLTLRNPLQFRVLPGC